MLHRRTAVSTRESTRRANGARNETGKAAGRRLLGPLSFAAMQEI
eukprot:COSAG06_NODE_4628_length_4087_cov_9.310682_6_plen_45_part_00